MWVCWVFQRWFYGSVVYSILYLRWDFELLHHPQLKEAADSTLDEFELWQGEVAEAELEELHGLGFGDAGFLRIWDTSETVSMPP